MKIGVLGGSFDPPHNGHLFAAKSVLKNKLCQKVILIPCFKHPFQKPLTEAKHRLAMTKILETKNIEASDIEIKSPAKQDLAPQEAKISYSIDTLHALKKQFPQDDFVWIIGEDQIKDFKKWKRWQEIKEQFGLIVVPRKLAVSSSDIRKKIREGKDIEDLVPKKVKSYIIKHKLYGRTT